jgi:diguanylate cyclase (GGDEF)-like protein
MVDGAQFSIAMADLDHFKVLNDTHGHEAGDRALQLFSHVLRSSLRPEDVVARYGGEEFVVLLPSTDMEGALTVLQRLQRDLEKEVAMSSTPPFTASWGLTDSSAASTFAELVAVADSAMYGAKRSGRNCIMVDSIAFHAARDADRRADAGEAATESGTAPGAGPGAGTTAMTSTGATVTDGRPLDHDDTGSVESFAAEDDDDPAGTRLGVEDDEVVDLGTTDDDVIERLEAEMTTDGFNPD